MKSQDSQEKKFRQLSDEELEKVTGGGPNNISAFFGGAQVISMSICAEGVLYENGKCPQK